jgi:hypothetical protein
MTPDDRIQELRRGNIGLWLTLGAIFAGKELRRIRPDRLELGLENRVISYTKLGCIYLSWI